MKNIFKSPGFYLIVFFAVAIFTIIITKPIKSKLTSTFGSELAQEIRKHPKDWVFAMDTVKYRKCNGTFADTKLVNAGVFQDSCVKEQVNAHKSLHPTFYVFNQSCNIQINGNILQEHGWPQGLYVSSTTGDIYLTEKNGLDQVFDAIYDCVLKPIEDAKEAQEEAQDKIEGIKIRAMENQTLLLLKSCK